MTPERCTFMGLVFLAERGDGEEVRQLIELVVRCNSAADEGDQFCPKHEWLMAHHYAATLAPHDVFWDRHRCTWNLTELHWRRKPIAEAEPPAEEKKTA